MKHSFIIYIFFLCTLFSGCEKADVYVKNPRENFEALWKILDEHYCFFEFKEIDWNEVHNRYNEQISDTLSQYELFDLLGKMMAELKDGHTNLYSTFDVARYWKWYEDYPPNFYEEVQRKYLGTDYKIAGGMKYQTFMNGQIGYAYYGSFSSGVSESNLDQMFLHFKNCKGLILDIRNNGGGSLLYSERIAARFLENKTITGYILHKTGPGHNDFSEPYELTLNPSEYLRWLRPVVILTNRHCYSAANDFVNKVKKLKHVLLLGDQTGGGSGFPFSSELPNGWAVRFSACPILDANKQHTEFGIPPDIKVSQNAEDLLKEKDTLIEEAIKRLMLEGNDKNWAAKYKK